MYRLPLGCRHRHYAHMAWQNSVYVCVCAHTCVCVWMFVTVSVPVCWCFFCVCMCRGPQKDISCQPHYSRLLVLLGQLTGIKNVFWHWDPVSVHHPQLSVRANKLRGASALQSPACPSTAQHPLSTSRQILDYLGSSQGLLWLPELCVSSEARVSTSHNWVSFFAWDQMWVCQGRQQQKSAKKM